MEQEGKAAAIGGGPSVSIRAPERRVASDHPPVEPPHGWRFGRYELLGRLAYGGMAEIYLARESAYGLAVRYAVIKRVLPHISNDPEFVGLFMDEARVAMSLTHPNISHIYEFGRIEGSYFLAMEWVNGIPLHKIIKRSLQLQKPLPMGFGVKIVSGIAEALDYAHAARDEQGRPLGIVHRDVTPHNIMLTFDGSPKLLDFGIAMAASRNTDTRTGLVRGKLAYMSPQQCLARAIDGRSDIFSLGVCLYEAVTGRRLYRRDTDFEVCDAILKDPVPSLRTVDPELPEELDAIVQRCLAKNPEERYQRAGQLQRDLQRFLAERREVVAARDMAEALRDLFPVVYKNGPPLDNKTDLLNSLPRFEPSVEESERRFASAPPTSNLRAPRAPSPTPENDVEILEVEPTPSRTHTAATPVPRVTYHALWVALLAVLALSGVSVWALWARPQQASPAPASRTVAPAVSPPEAPVAPEPSEARAEAEEPNPAAALQGTVWLTSEPTEADIYINGNPTGHATPAQLAGIWPGTYRITLRKPGYDEYRTRVRVQAGRVTQATAQMMTRAEAREFYRKRAEERAAEGEEPIIEPSEETVTPSGEAAPTGDDTQEKRPAPVPLDLEAPLDLEGPSEPTEPPGAPQDAVEATEPVP